MEQESRWEEHLSTLYHRVAEMNNDPSLLNQIRSLGSFKNKEELCEKVRELLERNPNSRSQITEPPGTHLQTFFPPLSSNQVPIYKLLQNQMGFMKYEKPKEAYKGYVEDMEAIYRGEFKFGKKDGIGEAVLEDGSLIAGEFSKDSPHGQIAAIAPNGFSFFGKIAQGESNDTKGFWGQFIPKNRKFEKIDKGVGVVYGDDGTKYIGAFVNGLKHGFGIEINNRDCVYRGFWQRDGKHGEGILTDKKGSQYLQKWEDGLLKTQKKLT